MEHDPGKVEGGIDRAIELRPGVGGRPHEATTVEGDDDVAVPLDLKVADDRRPVPRGGPPLDPPRVVAVPEGEEGNELRASPQFPSAERAFEEEHRGTGLLDQFPA